MILQPIRDITINMQYKNQLKILKLIRGFTLTITIMILHAIRDTAIN